MKENIMAKMMLNRFKESIDIREEDLGKHKNKISMINSLYSLINKDKITSTLDYLNQKEKKKKVQLPDLDKVQNNLDYTEELLDFQKELINNEVISRNPYNYQALMGLKNPAKETEKKGSDKEGNILKRVLNYYLYELGLTPLKEIENYTPEQVFYLSTKGDFEIGLQLKKLSPIEASYFEQNQVMRDAMITLGFREVIGCNIHLVGSLFEALYYIACIQGNCDISNRIFKALTRTDEPMKLIHVPK